MQCPLVMFCMNAKKLLSLQPTCGRAYAGCCAATGAPSTSDDSPVTAGGKFRDQRSLRGAARKRGGC
eukprot:6195878-Pleurochrysis_carterae.AAC.2